MSSATEQDILRWAAREVRPDCPDDAIPTATDLHAWLVDAPRSVLDAAGQSLDVMTGAAGWQWRPYCIEAGALTITRLDGTTIEAPTIAAWRWSGASVFSLDLTRAHAVFKSFAATCEPDEGPPEHPAVTLIRAWMQRPRVVEPFRPTNRASLPRLHRVSENEATLLSASGIPDSGPAPGEQFDLPGFGPVVSWCPSWLLWMFDQAGGESMAAGRGAPWPMRLFVGALVHVRVLDRTGRWVTIRLPNDDEPASDERPAGIHTWLHPRGWWPANKRRDWYRFPAALDAMRDRLAYVPVSGVGSIAMLFPSVIPREPTDPFVEFTVRIPPSAAHGARIDWPRLCQYGTKSAALYRAYLSASAWMDKSAHRGHPVTREIHPPLPGTDGKPRRKGGRILRDTTRTEPNPAARFVEAVTDRDLARMIGFDADIRQYRAKAREAFERLHSDGVIDLVQQGGLWWIYGPKGGAGR